MKPSRRWWHGGLAVVCYVLAAAHSLAADPQPVRTRAFDVAYAVNEAALPLEAVSLWFTLDGGATWQAFGDDADRQSPITFHAAQEGHHGFYVVLRNASGASSTLPAYGTRPQAEVFVDTTPPVVQLHALQPSTSLGRSTIQIRWTAIDANFSARPISISYQRSGDDRWRPAIPDPLANTGRFDWIVPETLTGTVAVRVTARDRGDHRVDSEPQRVELVPLPTVLQQASSPPATTVPVVTGNTVHFNSTPARDEASRLFAEAIVFRDRGEYREGIVRLRKAVRLDPQHAEAFAEMAYMLYRSGDMERALGAFELALKQEPAMRAALRGAAMVYRQRNDFAAAAEMLRRILRYNPNDAEVWMNLGDIAVYQGDEVLARECYTRASQIDPNALDVVADARHRLELMARASRHYAPAGN